MMMIGKALQWILLTQCMWIKRIQTVDLSNCNEALGMQSYLIPDQAITASSTYDASFVGPAHGRLNIEGNGGGAWCPGQPITKDSYEWLQIEFSDLTAVTQVETQGRYGQGQGQEYTEAYMLDYQRYKNTDKWTRYHDRKKSQVFVGNSNTFLSELRNVTPPLIARRVRIIPVSEHPRTVCMRVELRGCLWTDGLLSYSMPQGETRGLNLDFFDFTYDGVITSGGQLVDGLGQLTDGLEGHSNFRLDTDSLGRKGYQWVGWRDDSGIRGPVEINFRFDNVRNFSGVTFHCNNVYTREIQVFRKVHVHFSMSSTDTHQGKSVTLEYTSDVTSEQARNVIVPVPHLVGLYVTVQLFFDAKWMLISEVHFDSVRVYDEADVYQVLAVQHKVAITQPTLHDNKSITLTDDPHYATSHAPLLTSRFIDDNLLLGIVLGACAVFLLLFIVLFSLCLVHYRRQGTRRGTADDQVKQSIQDVNARSSSCSSFCRRHDADDVTARSRDRLNGVSSEGGWMTYGEGWTWKSGSTLKACDQGELIQGSEQEDSHHEQGDLIQARRLPDLPVDCNCSDRLSDGTTTHSGGYNSHSGGYQSGGYQSGGYSYPYAVHQHAISCPLFLRSLAQQETVIDRSSPPPLPPPPPPHPRLVYSDPGCLEGFSGHSIYEVVNKMDVSRGDNVIVGEFVREGLNFIEKLGEGPCGEVYLCMVQPMNCCDDKEEEEEDEEDELSDIELVAVKVLNKNVTEKARADFYREVAALSCLKNDNIVRLIGVCCQREPLCIVTEYLKYGDLKQFLQLHLPANLDYTNVLSLGCLMYMATQIACGMKYLESLNTVHRDLAARNCLVGERYLIKISDFGMSRLLHSADYYRIQGRAVLPIRWMAWESVLLGKFSSKSDVWSFGVTLWEILTLASLQPFSNLSDEEVIDNCRLFYTTPTCPAPGNPIQLTPPHGTPKEVMDLMCQCWSKAEGSRPSFHEIHMFLSRLHRGFNCEDEQKTWSCCQDARRAAHSNDSPTLHNNRLLLLNACAQTMEQDLSNQCSD